MPFPTIFRVPVHRSRLLLGACLLLAGIAQPLMQGATYTVYTTDGERTLPFRTAGNVDVVALEQVAALFGLTVTEDALVGGLTVRGRGQTILLIPGQSFASIGPGRVVSMPGPLERNGGAWQVPIDFLRVAVGPALGTSIEVRRPGRLVLVGDVRLPQVSTHFERQGPTGRLVINIQPATPHQVSRQGNRLTIRFNAIALDAAAPTGLDPEFVTAARAEGTALIVDLGPSAATSRIEDTSPTQLRIDLIPPGPPPAAAAPALPAAPAPEPPVVEIGSTGGIRTIVLDPGHGGDDAGVTGPGGTAEKDLVLSFARSLKATIENRIGLRVLLTRERDEDVALDRRAALANNNKADLFISLHANASLRPTVNGAQVYSLRLTDYSRRGAAADTQGVPVPVLGGGSRVIDVLPWDMAQIGFTQQSGVVADILRRHLEAAGVPQRALPVTELPLRPLVGVNMPAVLVELGFLSNPDDERALNATDRPTRTINAVLETIAEIRQGVPARAPAAAARPQ